MCTVTYIPRRSDNFVLTSNRDENKSRATASLKSAIIGKNRVWFPVDPISGGSWIATAESNRTACILNGAFKIHQRKLPYKKSRGLVLLDYFKSEDFNDFEREFSFENIEPFTLIVCEYEQLIEFRWDGNKKYRNDLNASIPYIWSSSTLYKPKVRSKRESWFNDWLKETNTPEIEELFDFHRFGGEDDPFNGFIMNRDDRVQTLSITGIEKAGISTTIHHFDLINEHLTQHSLEFDKDDILETN